MTKEEIVRFKALRDSITCTLPAAVKRLWEKVLDAKAPPRAAIKAKCQECCGYEDYAERIRDCSVVRCPLWAYRPYQGKK